MSPEADPSGFWDFSVNIVWPSLLQGMGLTLLLTVASGCLGLILGFGLALARRHPRSRSLRAFASAYINLFRGTPLLLQILFAYFALPPLTGLTLDAFTCGILALSLNAGAYIAEIIRASLDSIAKGQREAAFSLGLSARQAMRHVILPQALRRMLPPLVNEFSALSKDTSLVSVIALNDLMYATQRLGAKYFKPWEVYAWAALGYLLIVLSLSAAARTIARRYPPD